MKNLDKATMIKLGLTAAGLVLTGLGNLATNKVKEDEFKTKVAEEVAKALETKAKES